MDEVNKIVGVSITVRTPEGKILRQRLDEENAAKWFEMMRSVSSCAVIHDMSPAWEELKWEIETISDWS